MNTYLVTLKHDSGTLSVQTTAECSGTAESKVLTAQNAPACALVSCHVITPIERLKKGDYFKMLSKGGRASKTVYVAGDYNRHVKKYWFNPFDDILGAGRGLKKGTYVVINFEF